MTALTQRGPAPVTGAVMIDGEVVCFDLNDFHMMAGDRAVVLAEGKVCVESILSHYDGVYLTPERKTRSAFVRRGTADKPSRLLVQVLGRYVPRQDEAAENARRIRAVARTLKSQRALEPA